MALNNRKTHWCGSTPAPLCKGSGAPRSEFEILMTAGGSHTIVYVMAVSRKAMTEGLSKCGNSDPLSLVLAGDARDSSPWSARGAFAPRREVF